MRGIVRSLRRAGPWLVIALSTFPAFWYIRAYPHDVDPEYPRVVRPTFNTYPPFAYRLAEACDTIDHAAVYAASAGIVLSAWGLWRGPRKRPWLAALALSTAAFWHAATPGPLTDGWYGLGFRVMGDPRAPSWLRLGLAGLATALATAAIWGLRGASARSSWRMARSQGALGLLGLAAVLMSLRHLPGIDREPFGYWPRWIYVWGLLAWSLALLRLAPAAPPGWSRRRVIPALFVAWLALDFTGRGLFWYQRPLRRLREVVPGRIYISAMPTYLGLELAQQRYHFRTIINLFPEHTSARSPYLDEEVRFARERGIHYVDNPPDDPTGEKYVARTIALAQDPSAWPILVHCHASMDRSPAWMGIYRFVVQEWPLADAIREIERHRGLRPMAAVTLLYNRVLPLLAPERSAADPTARLLRECAAGTDDPAVRLAARRDRRSVQEAAGRPDSPAPRR